MTARQCAAGSEGRAGMASASGERGGAAQPSEDVGLEAQRGRLPRGSGMRAEDADDIDPVRKDSIDYRVWEAAEGRPARQDANQRIRHGAEFDLTKEIVKMVNERGAQARGLRLVPRDRLLDVALSFREESQRIAGFHARS